MTTFMNPTPPLTADRMLETVDLSIAFGKGTHSKTVVDSVTMHIARGESYGLIGESGCGKSTILRTLTGQNTRYSGAILYQNREQHPVRNKDYYRQVQMVFQDPYASLHPRKMVYHTLLEPLVIHGMDRREARISDVLNALGLSDAFRYRYPHQLSGGMLQRIMIAMALSCKPQLLIADEPTTALDVTVQAQILRLLREQAQQNHMALMLITHDLGVIAQMADHVVVMYAGKIVEQGATADVLRNPLHPYTQGLIASRPTPGERRRRLYSIPGQVPDLVALPPYCAFTERCSRATERCRQGIPPLEGQFRQAACFYSGLNAVSEKENWGLQP
ncbi:putative D,D-dipeptide transport ATP-binding protein DdpD [Rahnella aquatilis]|nr:putative D,D-dipeptide transport ATP-binding protein DdpD [Rahnella aquatilis]